VRLIDSSGGAFEVTVDGALVFSKLRTGRHPDAGEVLRLILAHRGDVR
jgi:selT/selW/selH-like putative selenoprotein